jgi:hypothetical protein
LQAGRVFQILPLTDEVAAEVASLGGRPRIARLSRRRGVERLRLVTSDQRIIDSQVVPVIV